MQAYEQRLENGWQEDLAQQTAVAALERLLSGLRAPSSRPVKGLYLHGPVGRGKSELLNLFMKEAGSFGARRTHIHAFMAEAHRRLFDIKTGDPVRQLALEIAGECGVLGFDEFYITNIADAMLLGRLLEHVFKYGVVVIATSNWPMDELFRDGRNRKSFLPFLRILKHHLQAVDLGDGLDYRVPERPSWPLYIVGSGAAPTLMLRDLFDRYASSVATREPPAGIEAVLSQGGCGWYRFSDLCERPAGSLEYLELARETETVLVEGVPVLSEADTEAALRFVTLIDICYEHRRRVIISAEAYPVDLYPAGPVLDAFRRVVSRLTEMQTWA